MEIALVHENKLKVILSVGDMADLALDYDNMDHNDPETREVLMSILEQGKTQVRFNPRGAKLFIEVYPCEGGGCVLYFTCLPTAGGKKRGGGMQPVLFQFDSVEDLVSGACKTCAQYRQRIYRSSLYLLDGLYRLVVYPLDYSDRLSIYFLSEYGELIGEGELVAAITEEHGRELVRDDAIETIALHFGEGDSGGNYGL